MDDSQTGEGVGDGKDAGSTAVVPERGSSTKQQSARGQPGTNRNKEDEQETRRRPQTEP